MRPALDDYDGRRTSWNERGVRLTARTHPDPAYMVNEVGEVSDVQRGRFLISPNHMTSTGRPRVGHSSDERGSLSIQVDWPDGKFFNPPKSCGSLKAAFRMLDLYKTGKTFIALDVTAKRGAVVLGSETHQGECSTIRPDQQAGILNSLATRLMDRLTKGTHDG